MARTIRKFGSCCDIVSGQKFQFIYGPVSSWRLGSSLGVDPISQGGKVCPFDCVYCQLGRATALTQERRVFVPARSVMAEIKALEQVRCDFITLSGAGEPTLAKNLGEIIRGIKELRTEKVAVITNSALLGRPDVQEDLSAADFVMAKLDANQEDLFKKINHPAAGLCLETIVRNLKKFRASYPGRLAVQIMFLEANQGFARGIAETVKEIAPDEIQLNTPLRPCAVRPLPEAAMREIAGRFKEVLGGQVDLVHVYEAERKKVVPVSDADTLKRRGKTK